MSLYVNFIWVYSIRPNYRPCPHNRPSQLFTLFSLIIANLSIFFPYFLLYFHLLSPPWRSFGTSGREQIYGNTPGAY